MADNRSEWTILGRHIGTVTGWDEIDGFTISLYEFEPADGINLPSGYLCVALEKGSFDTYDDAGEVTATYDIIDVLKDVPRVQESAQ